MDRDGYCQVCKVPGCICAFQRGCDLEFEKYNKVMQEKKCLVSHNDSNFLVEPLKIVTITFNFALSHTGLNFDTIMRHYKPTLFFNECRNNSKGKKCKNDPEINNRMYNTLVFNGYLRKTDDSDELNRVVVRMFHNGSIGISGCRTIRQCVLCIRIICVFLLDYTSKFESPFEFRKVKEYKNVNCDIILKDRSKKRSFVGVDLLVDIDSKTGRIWRIKVSQGNNTPCEFIHEIKSYHIQNDVKGKFINITQKDVCPILVKIGTMNAIFKMNLFQYNLMDVLQQECSLEDGILDVALTQKETAVKVNYVPSKNRTLIQDESGFVKTRNGHIKYPNQLSMLVYASSINLAGAKSYLHIFEAYSFMINFIEKHPELINRNSKPTMLPIKKIYDRDLEDLKTRRRLYLQRLLLPEYKCFKRLKRNYLKSK